MPTRDENGVIHYDHEIGDLPPLAPAEHLALVTALQQMSRDEDPTPNVARTCVLTLARLAGVDPMRGDLNAQLDPFRVDRNTVAVLDDREMSAVPSAAGYIAPGGPIDQSFVDNLLGVARPDPAESIYLDTAPADDERPISPLHTWRLPPVQPDPEP